MEGAQTINYIIKVFSEAVYGPPPKQEDTISEKLTMAMCMIFINFWLTIGFMRLLDRSHAQERSGTDTDAPNSTIRSQRTNKTGPVENASNDALRTIPPASTPCKNCSLPKPSTGSATPSGDDAMSSSSGLPTATVQQNQVVIGGNHPVSDAAPIAVQPSFPTTTQAAPPRVSVASAQIDDSHYPPSLGVARMLAEEAQSTTTETQLLTSRAASSPPGPRLARLVVAAMKKQQRQSHGNDVSTVPTDSVGETHEGAGGGGGQQEQEDDTGVGKEKYEEKTEKREEKEQLLLQEDPESADFSELSSNYESASPTGADEGGFQNSGGDVSTTSGGMDEVSIWVMIK